MIRYRDSTQGQHYRNPLTGQDVGLVRFITGERPLSQSEQNEFNRLKRQYEARTPRRDLRRGYDALHARQQTLLQVGLQ